MTINAMIPSLLRKQPSARIVVVTGSMGASAILGAVNAGVSGIVLKHSAPERLIEAIRRVASGETWWDTGILELIASDSKRTLAPASDRAIADRQRQILMLILDGSTNREIASKLNSSESSVKASIQELFVKTGVQTRSQLVRIAVENHASEWLKISQDGDPDLTEHVRACQDRHFASRHPLIRLRYPDDPS